MDDLKQLRTALRVTQGQLAAAVGVSGPYITQVENGQKAISLELALRSYFVLRKRWRLIPPTSLLGVSLFGARTLSTFSVGSTSTR